MLIGIAPTECSVFAQNTQEITVYLSVSKYGEFADDKNGNDMAYAPVTLTDSEIYNLDDVFTAAHIEYHPDGSDGYASSTGNWGLSIDKLWGDTSYNFMYQVNGGTEAVMGLSHEVENGDYIDAYILESMYPDSELFTKFTKTTLAATADKPFKLTLLSESGYNEDSTIAFSPCSDAIITVNGKETGITTDENGVATITLDAAGEYKISAIKTRAKDKKTVTAITAPTCIVEAAPHPASDVINNIAESYFKADLTQDVNLAWVIADMAVFSELYPKNEYILTDDQKQVYLDTIIANAELTAQPNELAKSILALRALGYDAREVYTASLEKLDIVEKLTDLVDAKDEAVTNIYTLPYVIMALMQDKNYATNKQINYLIDTAVSDDIKAAWQNTQFGTDSATPMLLALAPYYDTNKAVKATVDETIELIKSNQREDGLLNGFAGGEAAAAGLAIAAFSVFNIDSEKIITNGKSLIDGLLTTATEELDGFIGYTGEKDSFSTEQGFRGLLSWRLLKENRDKYIYDFSSYPMEEAHATWATACPVTFKVSPSGAEVVIEGTDAVAENKYDLTEGTYTYTVSKSGYKTKTGTVEITADDALNNTAKTVNISLPSATNSGTAENEIPIRIKVMAHNADECDNSYSYKNNSSEYSSIAEGTFTIEKGQTVFDVLDMVLTENNISYIEGSYGYISSIDGISEFDHGDKSGWMFTVDGEHKSASCRSTKLRSDSTVVWFFTDNYLKEKGSESFSAAGSGGGGGATTDEQDKDNGKDTADTKPSITETVPTDEPVIFTDKTFVDVNADDWYYESVKYAYENKLMEGTDNGFEPDINMTRAMLVTVMHRLEGLKNTESENPFTDVVDNVWYSDAIRWAAANNIVNGVTDTLFAPNNFITREQLTVILYRYAANKGYNISAGKYTNILSYDDTSDISEYATDAMQYACAMGLIKGKTDSTLNPQDYATRAEIATILMRFIDAAKE